MLLHAFIEIRFHIQGIPIIQVINETKTFFITITFRLFVNNSQSYYKDKYTIVSLDFK